MRGLAGRLVCGVVLFFVVVARVVRRLLPPLRQPGRQEAGSTASQPGRKWQPVAADGLALPPGRLWRSGCTGA